MDWFNFWYHYRICNYLDAKMTAIAWAILIYTICTYPKIDLGTGAGSIVIIGLIVMLILTIKDIIK